MEEKYPQIQRDIYVNIHLDIKQIYEDQLKSSLADQDTLMECDQMRFILQRSIPCGPHFSSIGVTMLGFHWSRKSSI